MTMTEILRDLTRRDIFPRAAMAAAGAERAAMTPVFVALLDRLSRQPPSAMRDDDLAAVIPVVHLLGEWQVTAAYRPFLRLLRRPSRTVDDVLGDTITEVAFRLIAGMFDGDLQPLFEAIHDLRADDFARGACLHALVMIAHLHPGQRSAAEDFIRTFRARHLKASGYVLIAWTEAVADLGLVDMTDAVRAVFDKGLIPSDYCDVSHFVKDMQATLEGHGPLTHGRYKAGLIVDSIAELSGWYSYTDAYFAQEKARKVEAVMVAPFVTKPLPTPVIPVGRNDPCPCGSGKKYKICCLH